MTQTRNRRFGLSKSKITAFEQCPKKFWLATHRPELAEQDEGAEARFVTGNAVGEIACALHPGGVMVESKPSIGIRARSCHLCCSPCVGTTS